MVILECANCGYKRQSEQRGRSFDEAVECEWFLLSCFYDCPPDGCIKILICSKCDY